MKHILHISYTLILCALCCFCTVPSEKDSSPLNNATTSIYTPNKQVMADSAVVVSAHPLASKVGLDILRNGGNAIDAMVAVQFALAVVYPRAGNIGGGGFMIYRDHSGFSTSLDFREKAPTKAFRDMYLDEQGQVIDSLSRFGHVSVGVPGSVDGMWTAHQKFGKPPWKSLVKPARLLAQNGVVLTPNEAASYNQFKSIFNQYNPHDHAFDKDSEWVAGDTFIQADLARVLMAIEEEGRSGFYEGKTAEHLVKEVTKGGGMIDYDDLSAYKSVWRNPIRFNYKDFNIISMPPPSSGGICLAQLMQMVEKEPLHNWGFHDPRSIHIMAEAARRAYADRAEFLGDPDFYPVPVDSLISPYYARKRFSNRQLNKTSSSQKISHGNIPLESDQTTHFSIVDPEGNAISVTTTINSNYGSKVIVEDAGFFLNNEMDDFSAKPGSYNQFGLLGNEANAIQPHKRMLSSMTPTIVEKKDDLFMVVGTPGGSKIIMTVFQVIMNVIEFELPLMDAVHQPRFHFQWLPDTLWHEKDAFSTGIKEELTRLGYHVRPRSYIGLVEAILKKDGRLEGVADNRAEDTALGF